MRKMRLRYRHRESPQGCGGGIVSLTYEWANPVETAGTADAPPPEVRKCLFVMLEGDTPIPFNDTEVDRRLSRIYDIVHKRMGELK